MTLGTERYDPPPEANVRRSHLEILRDHESSSGSAARPDAARYCRSRVVYGQTMLIGTDCFTLRDFREFAAERLMDLEVEDEAGAAHGQKKPSRPGRSSARRQAGRLR